LNLRPTKIQIISSSSSSIKLQGCRNSIFTLSLKQPCLRKGETMYN
jgi:hypothetical protein